MQAERTPSLQRRPATGLWTELSALVASLRQDLTRNYHPERHYMRGPGPACRAKWKGV